MRRLLSGALLGAMFAATPIRAANPACQPVLDAMLKLYSVPMHLYSTETAGYLGGKVRSSEVIYVNNATYVQVNGKWRASGMTREQILEIRKSEQEKKAGATCRVVREEPVNGEPAILYSLHQNSEDTTMD